MILPPGSPIGNLKKQKRNLQLCSVHWSQSPRVHSARNSIYLQTPPYQSDLSPQNGDGLRRLSLLRYYAEPIIEKLFPRPEVAVRQKVFGTGSVSNFGSLATHATFFPSLCGWLAVPLSSIRRLSPACLCVCHSYFPTFQTSPSPLSPLSSPLPTHDPTPANSKPNSPTPHEANSNSLVSLTSLRSCLCFTTSL